tara:strand:+ start:5629 stop:6213 length:585 start_codon:yes stop_codon:yes gene_type:complete
MKKTEETNGKLALGTALARFQSSLSPAIKGSDQPFFKDKDGNPSKYADINALIEVTKEPLEKAGMAFSCVPDFTLERLKSVKTTTHPDGRVEVIEKEELQVIEFQRGIIMVGEQWLEGKLTIKTGTKGPQDPQAVLAGITYNRRGMKSMMLNISTAEGEDDDGESLVDHSPKPKKKKETGGRPVMTRQKEDGIL